MMSGPFRKSSATVSARFCQSDKFVGIIIIIMYMNARLALLTMTVIPILAIVIDGLAKLFEKKAFIRYGKRSQ